MPEIVHPSAGIPVRTPATDALPLGPDSLVWKYFGDRRIALIGPRPAVLHNMLAGLGQGVKDHSVFFADTSARIKRSLPPIYRTVYGSDDDNAGPQVRQFHINIRGDIPEDFTKLGKFFSIFGNSTLLTQRLEYNLLWYYSDIMTDVNAALTFYSQGQYFNFGDKIGEALVLAVGDHSSSALPFYKKMGFWRREGHRREGKMPRHIRKALKLAKKLDILN